MALAKISVVTKAALQKFFTGLKDVFVLQESGKGLSSNDYTAAEKQKLAGIAEEANKTIVENVLTSTSETNALSAAQGKVLDEKIKAINTNMEDLGAGDMLKSTYDVDGDGVVDDAEKLGGQLPAYYAKATEVEAAAAAAQAAQEAADAAQGDVDAVKADYLKATDKNTLQGNIDTLAGRVTTNEGAIETLNGNSSVAGSVDKKIADAINAFATALTDDGTVNTYKEALDYIAAHGSEYTTLLGQVQGNAAAIEALEGNTYNSENLVEITDSEINEILAS